MLITKVFKSGNSPAVRIPKEVSTDKKEFYISRIGEGYIIYPADDPWLPLRETMGTFPQNFMEEREQPSCVDLPERENL